MPQSRFVFDFPLAQSLQLILSPDCLPYLNQWASVSAYRILVRSLNLSNLLLSSNHLSPSTVDCAAYQLTASGKIPLAATVSGHGMRSNLQEIGGTNVLRSFPLEYLRPYPARVPSHTLVSTGRNGDETYHSPCRLDTASLLDSSEACWKDREWSDSSARACPSAGGRCPSSSTNRTFPCSVHGPAWKGALIPAARRGKWAVLFRTKPLES